MALQAIRQTRSYLPAFVRLIDGVVICWTAFLSQHLAGEPAHEATWAMAVVVLLAFYSASELLGGYCRVYRSPERELAATLAAWFASLAAAAVFAFLTHSGEGFARSSALIWAVAGGQLLLIGRMVIRAAIDAAHRRGVGVRRTAIAGTGDLAIHVAESARERGGEGFKLIGFYDDRDANRRRSVPAGLPEYQGNLDQLVQAARAGRIDTVLITLPMRAERRIQELLTQLADTTASVYVVPDVFVFELLHSRWNEVGGMPVVSIFETPIYGVSGWAKRGFDIAASAAAIVLLSPVLLACALAVRLSSPGPIIFKQKLYGLDGREIMVWKFRSMRTCDNGAVVHQATKGDPRVTRVGAMLRRTSLDELPQLFNVLSGTMSIVGPRPHASAHNELYRKQIRGYMMRHKVRPGITGLAQTFGCRGETDTIEKMQARIDLDHRYLREWSLWLDLQIIFRTFFVVLKSDAY